LNSFPRDDLSGVDVNDGFKGLIGGALKDDDEGFTAKRRARFEVQDFGFRRLVQDEGEKTAALRRFVFGFERGDDGGDLVFAERIKRVGKVGLRRDGQSEKQQQANGFE
jgi:hypothetical protein